MEQLNLSSNFVNVDDVKIHYSQFGSGPYLVWLHGGGPGANGLSNYSKIFLILKISPILFLIYHVMGNQINLLSMAHFFKL